jgi:hypothetical protein
MGNYREQLRAPASWWLLGLLCVALFGSTLWAGYSVIVAISVYAVLGGGCAAALLVWGSAKIEVIDGELRAGQAALPLRDAGEVAPLDEAQARAMRGPRADPAAFTLIRPYLKLAVYVEVSGSAQAAPYWLAAGSRPGRRRGRRRPPPPAPYWLVATRNPGELAAAIDRARTVARAGDSAVG